jgi:ribosome maturation factor RimP
VNNEVCKGIIRNVEGEIIYLENSEDKNIVYINFSDIKKANLNII